jgi:hypothetical protein
MGLLWFRRGKVDPAARQHPASFPGMSQALGGVSCSLPTVSVGVLCTVEIMDWLRSTFFNVVTRSCNCMSIRSVPGKIGMFERESSKLRHLVQYGTMVHEWLSLSSRSSYSTRWKDGWLPDDRCMNLHLQMIHEFASLHHTHMNCQIASSAV